MSNSSNNNSSNNSNNNSSNNSNNNSSKNSSSGGDDDTFHEHTQSVTHESLEKRVGAPNDPPSKFDRLFLEHLDSHLFRGRKENLWHPVGARGIYGGQLVGLALAAAMATVTNEKKVHSLHGYFLRRGDASKDLIFTVNPLRDGRSYSSRLVTAQQNGESTFVLIASFKNQDLGNTIVHQLKMPSVPDPESLPAEAQRYEMVIDDPRCPERWKDVFRQRAKRESPIDFRAVMVADLLSEFGSPSSERLKRYPQFSDEGYKNIFWFRSKVRLSDDPNEHIAVVAYASDDRLLGASKGKLSNFSIGMMASLDHVMWLHDTNFRADEWLLYVIDSPRSGDGRGLSFGSIFTTDGRHVVTVAQEGVIRLRQRKKQGQRQSQGQGQRQGQGQGQKEKDTTTPSQSKKEAKL